MGLPLSRRYGMAAVAGVWHGRFAAVWDGRFAAK
jgi:hypothetical protein